LGIPRAEKKKKKAMAQLHKHLMFQTSLSRNVTRGTKKKKKKLLNSSEINSQITLAKKFPAFQGIRRPMKELKSHVSDLCSGGGGSGSNLPGQRA